MLEILIWCLCRLVGTYPNEETVYLEFSKPLTFGVLTDRLLQIALWSVMYVALFKTWWWVDIFETLPWVSLILIASGYAILLILYVLACVQNSFERSPLATKCLIRVPKLTMFLVLFAVGTTYTGIYISLWLSYVSIVCAIFFYSAAWCFMVYWRLAIRRSARRW